MVSFLTLPFAFPLLMAFVVWTVAIKGYALWHAARGSQNGWFIFLLVVNLLGIPEIVYLVWFRNKGVSASHVAPAPAPAPSASTEA